MAAVSTQSRLDDWLARVAGSDPPSVELAGGTLSSLESTTVTEYNVTLTVADTQYSQALPANCRRVTFRCRTGAECRYAWATGKVAGSVAPYQTLKVNADYGIDGILSSNTLYFASTTAGVVIEMEAWA